MPSDIARAKLNEILYELPDVVFERMHETVLSDRAIAIGLWIAWDGDNTLCGCLAMDGYEHNRDRELPSLSEIKHNPARWSFTSLLGIFYGVSVSGWLDDFIEAFDGWGRDYKDYCDVLSSEGRKELRQIFAHAKTERETENV